jgi:hypothetical protein
MRFGHSDHAKDMVQTMISTNVMISAATRLPPPATLHMPPGACRLAPATQQVSGSSAQEHIGEHIVK